MRKKEEEANRDIGMMASTKQGLQEKEAGGVIVNCEDTHSNGKLISGVVYYRLNGHSVKIGARGEGGCDSVKKKSYGANKKRKENIWGRVHAQGAAL